MRIAYLTESDSGAQWDEYAGARASAVTDLFAWRRVVREAYGMASHFSIALENDRIAGALGLFELRHPVFGHYLATAVFGNDGGLHFDTGEARDALLQEARALARRLGVSHLIIRTRDGDLPGFEADRRFQTAIVDLEGDSESAWQRLPVKTRNQVRRGMKEGFTVSTGPGQVGAFYEVFHQHMRDLGSPAHGMRYYESILRNLGDRCEFFVVRDGANLVAGALVFWVNGTAMNYHAVALRRFNTRCPNYLLYWRMIEAAYAHGCRQFDMGRSEVGSSQLKFKANWAPREVGLCYNYDLVKLRAIPRLDPRNPRFRLAIASWQRLPLFVTRALGPHLISGVA